MLAQKQSFLPPFLVHSVRHLIIMNSLLQFPNTSVSKRFSLRTLIDTVFSHYCRTIAGHIKKKIFGFWKTSVWIPFEFGSFANKASRGICTGLSWTATGSAPGAPASQRWAQERAAGGRAWVCPRFLWGGDPRPGGDSWEGSPDTGSRAAAAAGPGERFRTLWPSDTTINAEFFRLNSLKEPSSKIGILLLKGK